MLIRSGEIYDIEQILEIIRRSYATVAHRFNLTVENCPKHPSNCSYEWIQKDLDRGVKYYLLESESEIVGCFALERADSKTCYLERLAVLPDRRNQGFGRILVMHCFEEAEHMGFETVGIGIIAKQHELKRWYQNMGFSETGRKKFDHLPFEVAFMEYKVIKKA